MAGEQKKQKLLNVFLGGVSRRNPIFDRNTNRSMDVDYLAYKKTGYFSKLITDYLDEKEQLRPFYSRFPTIASFEEQIREKEKSYPKAHRSVLCKSLHSQYKGFEVGEKTLENIDLLESENCFTVVTGHQLNLFTGPLYFLYKIISAINLCEQLREEYPEQHFIPVYWMATEDHDFDEINFFNFQGKKIQWTRESTGAVGRLDTRGLDAVYDTFKAIVGNSVRAKELLHLFKESYLEHDNLADATRYLANALFGEYGLVIVDGDDRQLKNLMIPYIREELVEGVSFKEVSETIEKLNEADTSYKIQVNPREINYFFLTDGFRERIVQDGNNYSVHNTTNVYSEKEILNRLGKESESFSPNVITRPLYQEVVLPNLCYIGGGGEIAYWLELKSFFHSQQIPLPILLLRNSALVMTEKMNRKLVALQLSVEDLFLKQNSFINKKIREISNINIDFSDQKKHLQDQFADMYRIAELTDPSFLGAVRAQEAKQLKGLDHLEKRLLKAQKRKLRDQVIRMTDIQNELFPSQSLQERTLNFSELYLEYGPSLIQKLKNDLNPMDLRFTILKY